MIERLSLAAAASWKADHAQAPVRAGVLVAHVSRLHHQTFNSSDFQFVRL
ncbi:hypothetical protein HCH_03432 [Hahella chejuensis KCTC 2396]|uniref:Uncharacterized protein n=1 Tax=Hahella chejuensis (strain KCTC 2396) TaxID=349521 RepID=Q2SGP4_HAHCH|nr:hypothetical protein HCH_03432 [Hahella chejuensis KCTC 2396]